MCARVCACVAKPSSDIRHECRPLLVLHRVMNAVIALSGVSVSAIPANLSNGLLATGSVATLRSARDHAHPIPKEWQNRQLQLYCSGTGQWLQMSRNGRINGTSKKKPGVYGEYSSRTPKNISIFYVVRQRSMYAIDRSIAISSPN